MLKKKLKKTIIRCFQWRTKSFILCNQ